MCTWVLAIGRPIVIGAPAARIGDTVDQIVVSVGPYMLSSWPRIDGRIAVDERRRQRLAAEQQLGQRGDRASPAGSAATTAAIDGVHWRWVTPWRSAWATSP